MIQEAYFQDDGKLYLAKDHKRVLISEDFSGQVIEVCVREYAKRSLIAKLESLKDKDPQYSSYAVPASMILEDKKLLNAIAFGLVGAWERDLDDEDHLDNEISFWIEQMAEAHMKNERSESCRELDI